MMQLQRNLVHNYSYKRFLHCPSKILPKISKNCFSYKSTESKESRQSVKPGVSWINSNFIPMKLRPYFHLVRADKQVGTMLLLWPCCWSIALAAPFGSLPDVVIISKFAIGAVLMRSAGCIINDLWDKDFDKQVERTRARPLASGELSVPQALAALAITLSGAAGVLMSMKTFSIVVGLGSMPLVVAYPLMKRYTYAPQLFLGMAFNWGALLGWVEVTGACSLPHTLPLYIGGICWTLVYDTIYGYQDRDDDAKIGLKSTALLLGEHPHLGLAICAGGAMCGITLAGYTAALSAPFYVGMGAAATQLGWQIATININDSQNLWNRFSSNQLVGALVSASIIAGHF